MLWACGRSYPCAYPLFASLTMVRSQRLQKQPTFYGLLFVVCLTIVLLVASPGVSAKEKPKPKLQDWQINGILAALEDSSPRVQGFALGSLTQYDAKDLKSALKKPEAIAQKAASLLKDKTQDGFVRGSAAGALSNLGETAKPFVPDIANLLKDKTQDGSVRGSAANALERISQLDFNQSLIVLDVAEYKNLAAAQQWRFRVYFLSGGSDEAKTLLKWMGKPQLGSIPTQLNHDEGVKTLNVFTEAWNLSKDLPNLQKSLASAIANVVKMVEWQTGDTALLTTHYQNLKTVSPTNADFVKGVMNRLTIWQWFSNAGSAIAVLALFWLALIFAYPKFPQV